VWDIGKGTCLLCPNSVPSHQLNDIVVPYVLVDIMVYMHAPDLAPSLPLLRCVKFSDLPMIISNAMPPTSAITDDDGCETAKWIINNLILVGDVVI